MSTSGYKDVIRQESTFAKQMFNGGLLIAGSVVIYYISTLFEPVFEYSYTAGGFSILALGIWVLVKNNWHKIACPNCNAASYQYMDWACPNCSALNKHSFFGRCSKCLFENHAFECPYCSQPMLLTKASLSWDKNLVDKHTAKPVIPGQPAPQAAPAPQTTPTPEPPNPLVAGLRKMYETRIQGHEEIAKIKEDVQKHGDLTPEEKERLIDDLQEFFAKHRMEQSRKRR